MSLAEPSGKLGIVLGTTGLVDTIVGNLDIFSTSVNSTIAYDGLGGTLLAGAKGSFLDLGLNASLNVSSDNGEIVLFQANGGTISGSGYQSDQAATGITTTTSGNGTIQGSIGSTIDVGTGTVTIVNANPDVAQFITNGGTLDANYLGTISFLAAGQTDWVNGFLDNIDASANTAVTLSGNQDVFTGAAGSVLFYLPTPKRAFRTRRKQSASLMMPTSPVLGCTSTIKETTSLPRSTGQPIKFLPPWTASRISRAQARSR